MIRVRHAAIPIALAALAGVVASISDDRVVATIVGAIVTVAYVAGLRARS